MKIYKKYIPWSWFFFGLLFGILATTTTIFTLIPGYKIFPQMPSLSWSWDYLTIEESTNAMKEIYDLISTQYYTTWTINQPMMSRQAMSAFVDALWDPFSSYLPPEEWKEFNDAIDGRDNIEGIGAVLAKKDNGVLVEEVLKSSPAAQSDVKPLDMIIKVNGSWIQNLTIGQVVQQIRWKKWSEVNLTIARYWSWNIVEIIEKKIVRDTISIPSITSKILTLSKNKIGYIALSLFAENTDEKLIQEISNLETQSVSWIILDLRWNGGGLLPESVDVASHFLSIGTDVVNVKYRLYTDTTYKAEWNDNLSHLPVIILVNGLTASASEIITLAIKEWRCKDIVWNWNFTDTCDVIVIWDTTFGKWSIQNLQDLSFGWSIKLTVWKWFAPSGRSIDHIGIEPDIQISFDKERYIKDWYDNQLEKAKTILSQFYR